MALWLALGVLLIALALWWLSRPDELLEGDWPEDDPFCDPEAK